MRGTTRNSYKAAKVVAAACVLHKNKKKNKHRIDHEKHTSNSKIITPSKNDRVMHG